MTNKGKNKNLQNNIMHKIKLLKMSKILNKKMLFICKKGKKQQTRKFYMQNGI